MCEYKRGELLLCHDAEDAAAIGLIAEIENGEFGNHGIVVEDRLEERLRDASLTMREGISSKFIRLRVPEGQEVFKINILHNFYQRSLLQLLSQGFRPPWLEDSRRALLFSPNHYLAPRFAFARPRHDDYKKLLQWPAPSKTTCSIAILDTGVANMSNYLITDTRDFTVNGLSKNVNDNHKQQHGTAVADIIADYCPYAPLVIYKVADANGWASEWDTIAAMISKSGANLLNLSLGFGLSTGTCPVCGNLSHSSRSAVFQNALDQVSQSGAIIVAAAGNSSLSELDYPARFANAVAITSVQQNLSLSHFSNRSTTDEEGMPHARVFVAFGGEKITGSGPTEWVGTDQHGNELYGTSFAAAYASAIIADVWGTTGYSAAGLVQHLQANAKKGFVGYVQNDYGNGLIQS